MKKIMKKKLKQSVIGTLVLYFTLTAITNVDYSLFTLFLISSIVVFIGFKKLKPIVGVFVGFLLLVILSGDPSSIVVTLSALFNLAVGVAVAVWLFMYATKKKFRFLVK